MAEETRSTDAKRPGYVAGPTRFLLPDRLQPPGWEHFGGRWAALLLLTGIWLAAFLNHQLWFSYDAAAGSASVFGVTVQVSSEEAGRTLFLAARCTLCVMYIGAGLAIHGWKQFAEQLGSSDWMSVLYHVFAGVLILVVGAMVLERLGFYSAAPKTSSMFKASRFYIVARVLALGVLEPAAEELGLRYVCFGALRAKMKFIWAALLSSLAFGLLHFSYPDPGKMLLGALAGLALCWSYERTRSFATPVAIHLINNLLGV